MRKRAQRKEKITVDEPKHITQKTKFDKKSLEFKKNWWVAISLVGIFLLVLFLNSYFNVVSGDSINPGAEGLDKYYLSGPDPYYNMRLVDETLFGDNAGYYPFYSSEDPLLNYPLGRSGSRAPLFNMVAIGFSRLLIPFMNEIDAIGYSMQFIPALFGALLIIPTYMIGKTLFGKKEGVLAALIIAIIPIHISSGHGSAFALFDHDSFNLFLYFTTFYFLIKAIKEKETKKSILYSILGGIPLAALSMTWVEARFLYVLIAIYAISQMIIDIFAGKIEIRVPRSISIILLTGYLISLPVLIAKWARTGLTLDIPFFLCIGVIGFGIVYYIFGRKKVPWTISIPIIFGFSGIGLAFLYIIRDISTSFPLLSPLKKLSDILYGVGIYGNKVSLTIAEAGTYNISRTVMSFGPTLYWIAIIGVIFLMYYFIKNTNRRDYLLIIILLLVELWLTGIAGRFLNDLVPLVAILSAWIVWFIIDKIDYKKMVRNIKSSGGGFHGLRKGINFLHIFGILFVALLIILPNAYLAFDAAIPSSKKNDIFGDLPSGGFGTSLGKEAYWLDALEWLKEQDSSIEKPINRPGFISWWDYGFYEVAIGDHPTVADNFQDGIPPAANFHTATSENEAVIVWIIRLLEGNAKDNNGKLTDEVVQSLEKNVGISYTINITKWVENPTLSPSYNTPIGKNYNEDLSNEYPIGQQWPMNAVYHDMLNLLGDLNDEEITWFYHDIQDATGYSIRYYGVEGYDKQIFNIFGFLADKSLLLVAGGGGDNPEDDFVLIKYVTQSGKELTFIELEDLSDEQIRNDPPVRTKEIFKDAYFETMFYKTYIGLSDGESGSKTESQYQLPCFNMKHFYAEYISPPEYQYYEGKGAVVIAKYYAGAFVNGTILFENNVIDGQVVVQKNITQYGTSIPVDHDRNSTINGSFSVIVPGGNVTIQARRYPELNDFAFVMKNVTFNDIGDSELKSITDDEAMRKSENYTRFIYISINPADIEGYVYNNLDNISDFNLSIDEGLLDYSVTLIGIKSFNPENGEPNEYDFDMYRELKTNETGYYSTSELLPGYYQLIITDVEDFIIKSTIIPLYEGKNLNNIPNPKPGSLAGTVYFDQNNNNQYDPSEEMDEVKLELLYSTNVDIRKIDSQIVDTTGKFMFSSLVPGEYILNATKIPGYRTELSVIIRENETTLINLSMNYAEINVNGNTNYGNNNIANVSIDFIPNLLIKNNTAQPLSVKSDKNGEYIAMLLPGYYNVTINQTVNESGVNVTYKFSDQLFIQIGEDTKKYDLLMRKE